MGNFCIGGVAVHVGGAPSVVSALDAAWAAFACDGSGTRQADGWRVEVTARGLAGEPARQRTLPVLTPHPQGGWAIRDEDFTARVHTDGRVLIEGPDARHPADFVIRTLVAQSVVKAGGLVVHGVALATSQDSALKSGAAALFTGESGAGKSTLGRCGVEGGLRRLADELVVLRPAPEAGSHFFAHGTPWNVGTKEAAPLRLCGVLAHDPSDWLETALRSDILRVLISNVLVPEPSAQSRAQVLRNAAALLGGTRTARLHFAPSPAVARVLQEALSVP